MGDEETPLRPRIPALFMIRDEVCATPTPRYSGVLLRRRCRPLFQALSSTHLDCLVETTHHPLTHHTNTIHTSRRKSPPPWRRAEAPTRTFGLSKELQDFVQGGVRRSVGVCHSTGAGPRCQTTVCVWPRDRQGSRTGGAHC